MKGSKKLITLLTLLSFLTFSSTNAYASEYCANNGGCGYDECCRASTLAPAIALGTIALVAIIALAIQNTSGHSHCHSHNSCSCH